MRGKPLSFDQRRWLVYLYINGGYEASKPYAVKCGIKPKYVAALARARGHCHNNRLKWLSMNDPKRAREIYWPWVRKKNYPVSHDLR